MYVFDYGAPVGFRLATRHPERIAGLVVQNGNAYVEGLSSTFLKLVSLEPAKIGARDKVLELFTVKETRSQYETGEKDPTSISPVGWIHDQHYLDIPGRKEIQIELSNDPFFIENSAHVYLQDLPDAQLHIFDTCHFALEECLPEIAPLIAEFLDRVWK
ncbi:uncharacterized protein VTP21DRAFT_5805 [Calcarisporiella thermophila]|uniref:uncharacterized protein n=1 Tax=Calcarisporiella thermophila TaxID=911321 RepID=UPI003742EF5E